MEKKTLEPQTNGRFSGFERIVESANQNQVAGDSIDNKFRKAVDEAILTVENFMLDAILTTMDNVVIPRAEMAVRSITGSSALGPNIVVRNPDRSDFTGSIVNISLMPASSHLDLKVDQDTDNETRNVGKFEDGDFPALKLINDRRSHTHQKSSRCP